MELKDLIRQYRSIKADPKWVEKSQAEFLAYFKDFKEKFTNQKGRFFYFTLKPVFISLFILTLIFSSVNFLQAVEKSLPGQSLYSLKRFSEELTLKLSSPELKSILRTEMTRKRLEEAKALLEREGLNDSEISPVITKAAQDFQKEFLALKKEISQRKGEEISELVGSFPVQDNKKIINLIQTENLDKILAETKEALKENKIEAALEKTNQIEKIIYQEPVELKESPTENEKKEEKSTSPIKQLPTKPFDFKTDLIKE